MLTAETCGCQAELAKNKAKDEGAADGTRTAWLEGVLTPYLPRLDAILGALEAMQVRLCAAQQTYDACGINRPF